ncbi:hypothetical protein AB0G60_23960 [Streptomyces angustmyceticus]|uniref:hypothetical protein n=1 Tax=Streptomyces angustmyceticus TaxID=285578 RepID=UPI000A363DCF|nr:hypothetical protein [Streptomyces angustmyceticus]UAL68646.1 hypothetical protein K7396_20705 [Streptomyces angustmyceticus]
MMQRACPDGLEGGRRGIRAVVATGLALATVATVGGCAFARPRVKVPVYLPSPSSSSGYDASSDPSSAYEPTYSPSPTQETYDPDGRSDVSGSNCDFSDALRQFTYTVSITNPSTTDSFSYDMAVNWMKAKPADGKAYGLHERSVIVGPGDTETYTAKYTVNQSSIGQFWYTCQITRAHKTRM